MDIYKVIREPHITEKGTLAKEMSNQVCFRVDRRANKVEIRKAVEAMFKVKVIDVTTMNMRGKKRRIGKSIGRRPDWKKALVRIAPGEDITFFEGM